MQDILGRKIEDGDLVIGMAIGRHSGGMKLGVWQGKSFFFNGFGGSLDRKSVTNVYLIENPSKKELEIKDEIVKKIKEKEDLEKSKKEEKKSAYKIPKKELETNTIYKDLQGKKWLYLGRCNYCIKYDGEVVKNQEDVYCYISEFYIKKYVENNTDYNKYQKCMHGFHALKTPKQFTEKIEKLDNLETVFTGKIKQIFDTIYKEFELKIEHLD